MKRFTLLLLAALTIVPLSAQVPRGFNFQAVARNSSSELITNSDLDVVVRIHTGSENGPVEWEEAHQATTNEFGLFDLVVCGDNSLRTGGSAGDLNAINWGSGDHFIRLIINAGTGQKDLGAKQLLSVPYSLVSSESKEGFSSLEVQPVVPPAEGEALFMVKRSDGFPVFAVYEDFVWVYTDEENVKGVKGGFAVGGYTSAAKGVIQEYMRVSSDSTRIYIKNDPVKGRKGGFAVGGYNAAAKTAGNDLLYVSIDSTRIYVKNDQTAKGIKGGFAVGGYNANLKEGEEPFMILNRSNYFIGHNAGISASGIYNSVLGYESGMNITTGESNAFMGYQSGYLTNAGTGNLFLGYQTGYNNLDGDYNTFLGYQSGYSNQGGLNNTFLGSFAGYSNIGGSYNTVVGDYAGYNNQFGVHNTFLGTKAGLNNTTGSSNLFIGDAAGYENKEGNENVFLGRNSGFSNVHTARNVFIGTNAGYSHTEDWDNIFIGTYSGFAHEGGAGNVFLGYEAGKNNLSGIRNVFLGNQAGAEEQGSNKLYISNRITDSTNTFIWGDFAESALRINGRVGVNVHPEPGRILTVGDDLNVAVMAVKGGGNLYDYSMLQLASHGQELEHSYQLIHNKSNGFLLAYNDGVNIFPRIQVDQEGRMSLNNWETGTEVLDVNGNARIRNVGSGASANDLRITATGVLTTSTSDMRLKTDLQPLENTLGKILGLQGYSFIWKNDEGRGQDIGLVAQEVLAVFPELVFTNPSDGYLGINHSKFTALFVEAFREQQEIIDAQRVEIDDLKGRLARIEQMMGAGE